MTEPNSDNSGLSRRGFIEKSVIYSGGLLSFINLPRPKTWAAVEASGDPLTFTQEQWQAVEAITGRILPTDEDPGAIEANCVNFIDKALANEDQGQKSIYDTGLPGLDSVCRARFQKSFIDLSEAEQDDILASLESDTAEGWPADSGSSAAFFATIRAHTLTGFLADPKYGGNHNYEGWKLLGYPGPRHHAGGFTPEQMLGKTSIQSVWE